MAQVLTVVQENVPTFMAMSWGLGQECIHLDRYCVPWEPFPMDIFPHKEKPFNHLALLNTLLFPLLKTHFWVINLLD